MSGTALLTRGTRHLPFLCNRLYGSWISIASAILLHDSPSSSFFTELRGPGNPARLPAGAFLRVAGSCPAATQRGQTMNLFQLCIVY
jgi:hypothetical protein